MARHGAGLAADALAQVDEHAVALAGIAFSTGWLLVDAGAGNAGERYQGGARAEAGQLAEKGAANGVHGASGGLGGAGSSAHSRGKSDTGRLPATKVYGLDVGQEIAGKPLILT